MAFLVIVGIDGSGKDHVANVIVDRTGWQRRRGWFSGRLDEDRTTEKKARHRLAAERAFLLSLPITRHVLPLVIGLLARTDVWRRHDPNSVLVSWTPLRVAALAHAAGTTRLPTITDRLVRSAVRRRDVAAVVVTATPITITRRLADRRTRGRADRFDEFLDADPAFAQRFQAALVELTTRWMPTVELANDDASPDEILAAATRARPGMLELS